MWLGFILVVFLLHLLHIPLVFLSEIHLHRVRYANAGNPNINTEQIEQAASKNDYSLLDNLPKSQDGLGNTALHKIAMFLDGTSDHKMAEAYKQLFEELVKRGWDLNQVNRFNKTPLDHNKYLYEKYSDLLHVCNKELKFYCNALFGYLDISM
jgi:hypothetical protein